MNFITAKTFYDHETMTKAEAKGEASLKKSGGLSIKELRRMPSHILGPREFWMEFKKQAEALATASAESAGSEMLCTFVYQKDDGYRKFVVAHPEVYWWHYEHRPPERKCSYEVIPENCPCRLYLDLEYSVELNPGKDGPAMTNTVIDIFTAYLFTYWRIPCNRTNVINLDSSTTEKFSRHLIFNVNGVAFKDNYHVGRLVKSVCRSILCYTAGSSEENHVLSSFNKERLEQLFVSTKRDRKLFIDTAVYTRNRHFRIYKSTKWGKQSNLEISDNCKYIPAITRNDKELNIFLDSLVSYFDTRSKFILLEYSEGGAVEAKCLKERARYNSYQENSNCPSKYPALDNYINGLIHPGKIRSCKYYDTVNVLVYETSGYRYCENIGRCHKSNNVFWVANLNAKTLYQKCHDEDCSGFKSKPRRLPEEISFQISEEDDVLLSCVTLSEDLT